MIKWLLIFSSLFFSTTGFASVDIDLACKEKKEQQNSILSKMSTSVSEAFLAGQCTGYESYKRIDWEETCNEFIEQKKAILPNLSTSLKEAHLSGICVGAIYRVAKVCRYPVQDIDYLGVAQSTYSYKSVSRMFGCY